VHNAMTWLDILIVAIVFIATIGALYFEWKKGN